MLAPFQWYTAEAAEGNWKCWLLDPIAGKNKNNSVRVRKEMFCSLLVLLCIIYTVYTISFGAKKKSGHPGNQTIPIELTRLFWLKIYQNSIPQSNELKIDGTAAHSVNLKRSVRFCSNSEQKLWEFDSGLGLSPFESWKKNFAKWIFRSSLPSSICWWYSTGLNSNFRFFYWKFKKKKTNSTEAYRSLNQQ